MIKSRGMKCGGNITRIGEKKNIRYMLGIAEGKRPLGRHRHRYDNIVMDLRDMGWDSSGSR
jgi:hypothetical protein